MIGAAARAGRARRCLAGLLLASLLLATDAAQACPICFSGRSVSVGQRIDAADAVVLATPLAASGAYRVVEAIKGDAAAGSLLLSTAPPSPAFVVAGQPLLIVRNRSSQQWSALGSVRRERGGWLRAFVATGPAKGSVAAVWPRTVDTTADPTDDDWRARLALLAPDLESNEPLVAEIAYGELARTPYRLMRSLSGTRDPGEVLAWLEDDRLSSRRAGYVLLLGLSGGPLAADWIAARIDSLRSRHGIDNLAALLAADLEIRGPSGVARITRAYLTNKSSTLPEIEAALLALSVHGTSGGRIPRAMVVAAYRSFVVAHPPMAGFVVSDLSDWGSFEAAGAIEAALASGVIRDPSSRQQVSRYLERRSGVGAEPRQAIGADLPP
jgi:hypothetical protein